jgi:serine/threonine protein kinase
MPESGRRIGAYKLEERLESAQGTELWRALRVDAGLPGPTVVLIRCVADPDDAAALDRIRREHEDLRVLGDSRIPKVLGFYESQGALVLEDSPGTPLDLLLQAVAHGELVMDANTAVDIILEVAHGLRHAHSIVRPGGKIVHGHLEPSRVVLSPDGDVRVLGVGVTPDDVDPRYMPQELANRTGRDERTDQWQIGALLYELITGQAVYRGAFSEAWHAATLGDVSVPLDRLESRHPALTLVLRKVLATQPSGRYQVESMFLRALLTVSRSVSGKSRRRALGAEAAGIEPVMRPAVVEEAAEPGWSRVGASAEPGGPLVLDPGETGEQSEHELAEQNATDSEIPGMARVDLPDHDPTPLPDLFARPQPTSARILSAGPSAVTGTPGRPRSPAVNRPRNSVPCGSPVLAAVSAPEPLSAGQIQAVDNLSLRADEVTVHMVEDLLEERVDHLWSILLDAESSHDLALDLGPGLGGCPAGADDMAATVLAQHPPVLEPTAMISGRKRVQIRRDCADETPTDTGVVVAPDGLADPPPDLQTADGAIGPDRLGFGRSDPLSTAREFSGTSASVMGSERIEWVLFLAASVICCMTLWALVYVG